MTKPPPPTILVVDDEPIMIRLLDDMLGSRYDLAFAMSGTEALASVALYPPELILLDVELPDMSGYDVCRAVRNSPASREIPVIFLTSNDRQTDLVSGFEAGGMDYVCKPVNFAVLSQRIDRHLKYRESATTIAQE